MTSPTGRALIGTNRQACLSVQVAKLSMKPNLLLAICCLLLAVLACNVPDAGNAGLPSPAQRSPGATALPVPTATRLLTGVIAGTLSYPSEYLPAQRVVAFDVANPSLFYWVQTQDGQATFELPVPPGTYYVVAYLPDGSLAAGYSQAVLCGLKYECTDHSLIPVIVRAGERVNDVRPHDWYAPSGAFPPMP